MNNRLIAVIRAGYDAPVMMPSEKPWGRAILFLKLYERTERIINADAQTAKISAEQMMMAEIEFSEDDYQYLLDEYEAEDMYYILTDNK